MNTFESDITGVEGATRDFGDALLQQHKTSVRVQSCDNTASRQRRTKKCSEQHTQYGASKHGLQAGSRAQIHQRQDERRKLSNSKRSMAQANNVVQSQDHSLKSANNNSNTQEANGATAKLTAQHQTRDTNTHAPRRRRRFRP